MNATCRCGHCGRLYPLFDEHVCAPGQERDIETIVRAVAEAKVYTYITRSVVPRDLVLLARAIVAAWAAEQG